MCQQPETEPQITPDSPFISAAECLRGCCPLPMSRWHPVWQPLQAECRDELMNARFSCTALKRG